MTPSGMYIRGLTVTALSVVCVDQPLTAGSYRPLDRRGRAVSSPVRRRAEEQEGIDGD